MTPTPAETALWRALNPEPKFVPTFGMGNNGGPDWQRWNIEWAKFCNLSEYGRLAYFEGKVRDVEPCASLCLTLDVDQGDAAWVLLSGRMESVRRDTEHLARFHASARALAALGVITDDVMKEIEL